jgi:hypothetical protein
MLQVNEIDAARARRESDKRRVEAELQNAIAERDSNTVREGVGVLQCTDASAYACESRSATTPGSENAFSVPPQHGLPRPSCTHTHTHTHSLSLSLSLSLLLTHQDDALKEEIAALAREERESRKERQAAQQRLDDAKEKREDAEDQLRQKEHGLKDLQNVANQRFERLLASRMWNVNDACFAAQWVEGMKKQGKFRGRVFGPVCLELSVQSAADAAIVESSVSNNALLSEYEAHALHYLPSRLSACLAAVVAASQDNAACITVYWLWC